MIREEQHDQQPQHAALLREEKQTLAHILFIQACVPSGSDTLGRIAFDSTQANAITRSILKHRPIDRDRKLIWVTRHYERKKKRVVLLREEKLERVVRSILNEHPINFNLKLIWPTRK